MPTFWPRIYPQTLDSSRAPDGGWLGASATRTRRGPPSAIRQPALTAPGARGAEVTERRLAANHAGKIHEHTFASLRIAVDCSDVRRAWAFILRTLAAVRLLARDQRIPKPLRWLAGLGLLPIPGPFDELILLLVAPVFFIFYRRPMREAWERAANA